MCKEDGKTVLMFFSSTKCSSCKWVQNVYNKVADKYESQGKVIAYHWELDTGDNLRTPQKESGVPEEVINMFTKYNPNKTVPSFIFGCRYVRNGNSGSKNLAIEEDEFTKAIEKTLV